MSGYLFDRHGLNHYTYNGLGTSLGMRSRFRGPRGGFIREGNSTGVHLGLNLSYEDIRKVVAPPRERDIKVDAPYPSSCALRDEVPGAPCALRFSI